MNLFQFIGVAILGKGKFSLNRHKGFIEVLAALAERFSYECLSMSAISHRLE